VLPQSCAISRFGGRTVSSDGFKKVKQSNIQSHRSSVKGNSAVDGVKRTASGEGSGRWRRRIPIGRETSAHGPVGVAENSIAPLFHGDKKRGQD